MNMAAIQCVARRATGIFYDCIFAHRIANEIWDPFYKDLTRPWFKSCLILFTIIVILMIRPRHNFAHVTAAQLSCHMQNCELIEEQRIFFYNIWNMNLFVLWANGYPRIQYIPCIVHPIGALLIWFGTGKFYPYPPRMLQFYLTAPVPGKQSWRVWVNVLYESNITDDITTTRLSTSKSSIYVWFMYIDKRYMYSSAVWLFLTYMCSSTVVCANLSWY